MTYREIKKLRDGAIDDITTIIDNLIEIISEQSEKIDELEAETNR